MRNHTRKMEEVQNRSITFEELNHNQWVLGERRRSSSTSTSSSKQVRRASTGDKKGATSAAAQTRLRSGEQALSAAREALLLADQCSKTLCR